MKRLALVALGMLVGLVGCKVEEIGGGDGTIYVRNDGDDEVEVMIADTEDCFAGLRSSVNTSTTRMFSVGESSYLCIDEKPPGHKVEDGKRYVLADGVLSEE